MRPTSPSPQPRKALAKKAPPAATHGRKTSPRRTPAAKNTEQLVFTLHVGTGEVLKLEKVDVWGRRSDVREDIASALTSKTQLDDIEGALDEAFEAGISSVLSPSDNQHATTDASVEEKEIRKLLLQEIIRPEVRDHVRQRIMRSFLLAKTIDH